MADSDSTVHSSIPDIFHIAFPFSHVVLSNSFICKRKVNFIEYKLSFSVKACNSKTGDLCIEINHIIDFL